MLYKDLINYEPIESLVQLKDASISQRAINLVSSYVISQEMADRICNVAIPQLQFDFPADNKGLLIVGNYGTGKSHLLSVISAICQDATLIQYLTDDQVKEKATAVAGKFKVVIRTELGATTMPLREILAKELEENLKSYGVDYQFPAMNQSYSGKKDLEEMMQAFQAKFPDEGLILVVDELLDYLRSRNQQELVLDLNFLRELGEACKDLRFRFVAGVQEAIFDSPRFSFVAESLNRVRDRFEQVRIARRDLKFVVANRLLKKTAEQSQQVRKYLEPYTRYYDELSSRMDEFVALFPIHPNYIDTFESISHIEKREVLKTISLNMKEVLDQEIPEDRPGVLAYDSYWKMLSDNPSIRSNPTIKEVIDVNSVLITKVQQAFTKPIYKALALRIVNALSIHRLTTLELYNTLGATPQELKNSLFLYDANAASMGGDEPDKDLTTLVETVLREIVNTVSGQFISSNPDNGQYYLDLKKIEDYDAKIVNKKDTLAENDLNIYYNEALKRLLERMDISPYVTNYNIWQYEITWRERNAPRKGYLFFGAPNERSTAVPQRDFYIYFLRPYDKNPFKDQKLDDELFFCLSRPDEDFDNTLAMYAAAHDLSLSASGNAKNIYLQKSEQYLKKAISWLQQNIWNAFDLIYQGKRQSLDEWQRGKNIREFAGISQNQTANFRDITNALSSICLAPYFEAQAPLYPKFSVRITSENLKQYVSDAIRSIPNQNRSSSALAILDTLQLLDGNKISSDHSPIASSILEKLNAKGKGQVLNREELIAKVHTIDYFEPDSYRLEPDWILVVLAAMVYCGDIVLSVLGEKYDATKAQYLAVADYNKLLDFKHIELPKDWNLPSLKALFELVGLSSGQAQSVTQGNDVSVKALQESIIKLINRIIINQNKLKEGLSFWELDLSQSLKLENAQTTLAKTKSFLESLTPFNSAATLKNFNIPAIEIEPHSQSLDILRGIERTRDFINDLKPLLTWFSQAEAFLDREHPWQQEYLKTKEKILAEIQIVKATDIRSLTGKITHDLQKLKKNYIEIYVSLHSKHRLNKQDDLRKADLINDYRLRTLRKLEKIDIMPTQQVNELMAMINKPRTCFNLSEQNLQTEPFCRFCRFNPGHEQDTISASQMLNQFDQELQITLDRWTDMLLQNLKAEHSQASIALLNSEDKTILDAFLKSRELPENLDDQFIKLLKDVLAGLTKISISLDDIQRIIIKAGGSVSPSELKRLLEDFIDTLIRDQDPQKVRIVLE